MLDSGFTLFLMMILHLCSSILSTVCVGCFLFSSCFVYLSAVSTLFFSIISESVIFLLFITVYLLDGFCMYGVKDICVGQLYISNFYTAGVLFVGLFWVSMLLDGMNLPFDYTECESELVSGVITELSGIFFCLYSVMEISHLLLTTVLIASLCFGGLFICFNAILVLVFGFFYPRVIGFSLNITTAQSFVLLFLFVTIFLLFQWLLLTKFVAFFF